MRERILNAVRKLKEAGYLSYNEDLDQDVADIIEESLSKNPDHLGNFHMQETDNPNEEIT